MSLDIDSCHRTFLMEGEKFFHIRTENGSIIGSRKGGSLLICDNKSPLLEKVFGTIEKINYATDEDVKVDGLPEPNKIPRSCRHLYKEIIILLDNENIDDTNTIEILLDQFKKRVIEAKLRGIQCHQH